MVSLGVEPGIGEFRVGRDSECDVFLNSCVYWVMHLSAAETRVG